MHPNAIAGWSLPDCRKDLSVVIPCHNEAEMLPELYRRVSAVCREAASDYELVLVNDGSTDETWSILVSLSENDQNVVCVKPVEEPWSSTGADGWLDPVPR